MRKLFIVFAIIAGLFALQDSLATPLLPREKARTEIVIKQQEKKAFVATAQPTQQPCVFVRETLQKPQVLSSHIVSLILSSIYFHSSL